MSRIKHIAVWLSRIGNCKGFGVQSPWAYDLVCNVINQKSPFYAYESLAHRFPQINKEERRLQKLYFRLANYMQPRMVTDFTGYSELHAAYIAAGCNKARYTGIPAGTTSAHLGVLMAMPGAADMMIVSASAANQTYADTALAGAADGSLIIVEGINENKAANQRWKAMAARRNDSITFDLYYCGLIFVDKKKYKQDYVINF